MNVIEYNSDKNITPFTYNGRTVDFSQEVRQYFERLKEEKGCKKPEEKARLAICHRISFNVFSNYICDILNGFSLDWRDLYINQTGVTSELYRNYFFQMIAALCGMISCVEGIYAPRWCTYYEQYPSIGNCSKKNDEYYEYIKAQLMDSEEDRKREIVKCLDKMIIAAKFMVDNRYCLEIETNFIIRALFYDFLSVQGSKIIELLNNSLGNLKLGLKTNNSSIGAAYDCDDVYYMQNFEGKNIFLIENDVDIKAMHNLFTVGWRNCYMNMKTRLYFLTAKDKYDKEFILTSSYLDPFDIKGIDVSKIPIYCVPIQATSDYMLISYPDIILPKIDDFRFIAGNNQLELKLHNDKKNDSNINITFIYNDTIYFQITLKPGEKCTSIDLENVFDQSEIGVHVGTLKLEHLNLFTDEVEVIELNKEFCVMAYSENDSR